MKLSKEMAYDMRTIDAKIRQIEDFRKKPQKNLTKAIKKQRKMLEEVDILMRKVVKKIGEDNECEYKTM